MAASLDRASASATGSEDGGDGGATSSHSGSSFQIRRASLDGRASGRPNAAVTEGAQPHPDCPMRAASPAASRFSGVSRPCASRCSRAAASSGSNAASASNPACGSKSSAMASPRGVGAAARAGSTKANSSSRSKAGPPRRPRRRKLAGACTSSGGGRSRRRRAASALLSSSNSPSVVKMAARPCPATTDGASGRTMRVAATVYGYSRRTRQRREEVDGGASMVPDPIANDRCD